jgi:hypothetical protein
MEDIEKEIIDFTEEQKREILAIDPTAQFDGKGGLRARIDYSDFARIIDPYY